MGAEAPICSTVLQPVTKPLSVCLAAEKSRDLKLILFLGLASLGNQTTLIVKLAASRRVKLALSLPTRFRLAKARLWRLCGMIFFLTAREASSQPLQETHRATVFLLLDRCRGTADVCLCNRREVRNLRHARLLRGLLVVLRSHLRLLHLRLLHLGLLRLHGWCRTRLRLKL